MDKQLERCLSWALKGLSEHEAWAVKEEVNNAIRREKLKAELHALKRVRRLAKVHEVSFKARYPMLAESMKHKGWNPYKDYLDSGIDDSTYRIIKEAGSAEDAGINKQGESFDPDHDCPKCGGELDVEYKICECGWFKEGNADLLTDMRADK